MSVTYTFPLLRILTDQSIAELPLALNNAVSSRSASGTGGLTARLLAALVELTAATITKVRSAASASPFLEELVPAIVFEIAGSDIIVQNVNDRQHHQIPERVCSGEQVKER